MSGVLVAKTRGFWGQSIKLSVKEKLLVCGKGKLFQLMQSQPIKKSIFQHTKTSISHCTKANVQLQILSAKTYCELAVKQLFFRKTTVLRLHYGNPFAPIQSLYAAVLRAKPVSIRAAGKLYKITSGRALNRRSPACFLVTFCTMQKVTTRFLFGKLRGFPNLEAAHRSDIFAPQQLKPF